MKSIFELLNPVIRSMFIGKAKCAFIVIALEKGRRCENFAFKYTSDMNIYLLLMLKVET